jgi:hypothetical protein
MSSKSLCPGCDGRSHTFSTCPFEISEWYNPDEDIAFADSKAGNTGKAYKAARGNAWIQIKDKEGKMCPQKDYESDNRGDASRRRVSSQFRDTAPDDHTD